MNLSCRTKDIGGKNSCRPRCCCSAVRPAQPTGLDSCSRKPRLIGWCGCRRSASAAKPGARRCGWIGNFQRLWIKKATKRQGKREKASMGPSPPSRTYIHTIAPHESQRAHLFGFKQGRQRGGWSGVGVCACPRTSHLRPRLPSPYSPALLPLPQPLSDPTSLPLALSPLLLTRPSPSLAPPRFAIPYSLAPLLLSPRSPSPALPSLSGGGYGSPASRVEGRRDPVVHRACWFSPFISTSELNY